MIGGVPRGGQEAKRPNALRHRLVTRRGRQPVRLVAPPGLAPEDRRVEALSPLRVVEVGVGEQDPRHSAALGRGPTDLRQVAGVVRTGIDDEGGILPDQVGVGARERHRPGVGSDDPDDVGPARRRVDGREYSRRAVGDRWATFDCYGTLIDWEGGLRAAFSDLWPDAEPQRLLEHYHAVEPRVQAERDLAYREVTARSLAAVAAIDALTIPAGREDALAESLPDWPLAILSNTDPDLLAASVEALDVPFDLLITAADAGSYKPAPGHWERFLAETGAERSRHVHVAASLFHDIEPASRMGMPAVWINRLGESSDLPRAAELIDLSDLPDALGRLSGPG